MNKIVWIECGCNNYYNLIKKVENLNIKIYEVKYLDNKMYLKVSKDDFKKIDKYIVSYKFKVIRNTGINYLIDVIKNEKIFVICLLIGMILFICVKNLIVKIDIMHENSEIRSIIEEELDNYGIKVLSFKKSYDTLDRIKKEILDKYPDKLDWMEFVVNGMTFTVKVEERIITDTKKEDKVCDVIAKKSGVITDIKIESGEVLININDYVREGDTLISGVVKYNEEEKKYTCASGEVYATTWYVGSASIPYKYYEYEKQNKIRYNLVWEYNDNKHEIFRNRLESFESNYKSILKVFNFNLYLDKQVSVKKQEKTYSKEDALNVGIEKVVRSIKKKLSKKDTIIDKKVLKKYENNSTMDIEVFIVVKELISAQKEINIEKD